MNNKIITGPVRVSFNMPLGPEKDFPTIWMKTFSGEFKTTPALKDWLTKVYDQMRVAQDEDGGMREAGVEVLLAYEIHGYSIDDLYMRAFV